MEKHEWKEVTEDGKRFYRASFWSGEWTIVTTTHRRHEEWQPVEDPPEQVWRKLREIVWNKYQRKRCPWERVEALDRKLGDEPTAN